MAGFVAKGNNQYNGSCAVSGAAVKNGTFVIPNFTANTCAAPSANTDIAWFVCNENDNVDEQMINDVDYEVKVGKLAKIKRLLPGEEFVTTIETGTDPAKGDVCDVGNNGTLTKTSGSPAQTFTVLDIATFGGAKSYHCIVND